MADRLAQSLAREMDRVGIDILADLARDVGFARQSNDLSREGRIGAFFDDDAKRVAEVFVLLRARRQRGCGSTERSSSRVA